MRILIIGASGDYAVDLAGFLETKGHFVDGTDDAFTGMHLSLVNLYDAIVVDLKLFGMGGIMLCRKLRAVGCKATPIIMISDQASVDAKLTCLDAGADDFLDKAAPLHEMEARLRVLFRLGNLTTKEN